MAGDLCVFVIVCYCNVKQDKDWSHLTMHQITANWLTDYCFLCFLVYFVSFVLCCQYQCKFLPGKTRP